MKTFVVEMSYCVVNLLCFLLVFAIYVLHFTNGWGSLEATPFAAREQGSGEDLLTILGLSRNADSANRITVFI